MKKKETLEEVAKEIFKEEYICNGIDIAPAWREGFVTGAKWQAERMYNAKAPEMLEMLKYFVENNMLSIVGEEKAKQLIKEATDI
jgi:hypothetical protein